jgi:hypothetical protein
MDGHDTVRTPPLRRANRLLFAVARSRDERSPETLNARGVQNGARRIGKVKARRLWPRLSRGPRTRHGRAARLATRSYAMDNHRPAFGWPLPAPAGDHFISELRWGRKMARRAWISSACDFNLERWAAIRPEEPISSLKADPPSRAFLERSTPARPIPSCLLALLDRIDCNTP